ncbi:PIR Superfamily Protein [Plasmodium ovale curtisi]|uniref:PIR Superfamily Protein n=1 Tax=Plasmodium ovale curtisi TaxID=864141 RepID=A0A1A8XDG1_PLAOA|nr:PIR Superfamily Protein [Plasmodium ovale curtisi]
MPTDTEYFDFWLLLKQHNLKENVTLGDIYKKLDDMCSLDNNQRYCAIGKDKYLGFDNFNKLYYNLNGNKTKYEFSDKEFLSLYNYPQKFCNYLKYWLYDNIIFNKFDNDKIINVLKDMNNGDKIKGIKLFYDYIGSYDTVQKKSNINDKICEKLQQNSALGDTENASIGITMTVVPTLIALFVIFPILYKFTPFGPWLHKSVIKTKKFLLNPNENSTDTLLNHTSESDNGNFMERPHYITYHLRDIIPKWYIIYL